MLNETCFQITYYWRLQKKVIGSKAAKKPKQKMFTVKKEIM